MVRLAQRIMDEKGVSVNAVTLGLMEPDGMSEIAEHADHLNLGDSWVYHWPSGGPITGGTLMLADGTPSDEHFVWHRIPRGARHYVTPLTSGWRFSVVLYRLPRMKKAFRKKFEARFKE